MFVRRTSRGFVVIFPRKEATLCLYILYHTRPNNGNDFINNFFSHLNSSLVSLDGLISSESPTLNYTSLIESASVDSSQLVLKILRCAIESLDLAFLSSPTRLATYHIRTYQPRTLTTFFGDLTYNRHIFNHKSDKKSYFNYVDSLLGIVPRIKYDPCIRSELLELSLSLVSMQEAGRIVGKKIGGFSIDENRKMKRAISKQTVANIIHSVPSYPHVSICEHMSHTPDTIYIIADEKYKSVQGEWREDGKAKKHMTKLAVIFEGMEKVCNNRYKLINKYAYAGHGATFWDTIFDISNKRYDLSLVKNIIIMGDGANWIKKGKEDLCMKEIQTAFLLDRFHTMQSMNRLSKTYSPTFRYYIKNDMRQDFKKFYEIKKTFYDEDRQTRMKVQADYLLNNWNVIQSMYKRNSFGCPIESQIQHILASKISSVPKAYEKSNLKKLVTLLAEKENGTDMKILYLKGMGKDDKDGNVILQNDFDFSSFEKKPDSYDRNGTGKSIARILKNISSRKQKKFSYLQGVVCTFFHNILCVAGYVSRNSK